MKIKPILLPSLFTLLLFLGCASKEVKEWEPELDQVFRNKENQITFARTHFILGKTAAMNRERNQKIKKFMKETCHPQAVKIMTDKFTDSDFIALKYDYAANFQIRVYEFSCKRVSPK